MHRLLQATWLVAVSASIPLRVAAQGTPRVEIVAPAPLTRLPARMVTAEPRPLRMRWHSYEGSGTRIYPSLWVVNGMPLGSRPDGTIDRELAQRELNKIDCRDLVSIEVLRGDAATTRFGPNVPAGVVLLITRSPSIADDGSDER